jgi:hypothetical protein
MLIEKHTIQYCWAWSKRMPVTLTMLTYAVLTAVFVFFADRESIGITVACAIEVVDNPQASNVSAWTHLANVITAFTIASLNPKRVRSSDSLAIAGETVPAN